MGIFINQTHKFENGSTRAITLSGEYANVDAAKAHLLELEDIFGKSTDEFSFSPFRLAVPVFTD